MSASIGNIQSIVAIIQRDLAVAQGERGLRKPGAPAGGKRKADARAGKPFQARLVERVASISPDDPQAGGKALKAFIEALLLSELGDQLVNDPAFYQMADTIADRILAEPLLAEDVKAAVAHLITPVADVS